MMVIAARFFMSQIIFNEEWMIARKLTERTGLTDRQIKSYRQGRWIEGIHFKRIPLKEANSSDRGLVWYNLPNINRFIQEA